MGNFNQYSDYYDLLYEDKDTLLECDYLMNLTNRLEVTGNKWVELGAGSGRHGEILKKKGVEWVGYEKSREMLSIARDKGLNVIECDITKKINQSHLFDVALSIFHVFSYIIKNEDLLVAFRNAYNLLKKNGVFLFDVWYSGAVLTQKPSKRIKKVENQRFKVHRTAIPTMDYYNNTVNVHYDILVKLKSDGSLTKFSEDHLMRHFSIPEIKLYAKSVGFNFLFAEEWLTGKRPSPKTWGILVALRK